MYSDWRVRRVLDLKKYYITLLTVLLMLFCVPTLSVSAGELQIFDEGKKLSDAEFPQVSERLQQAADNTHLNVIVILGNQQLSDLAIESMADSTYDQLYPKNSDGICFYLDLSGAAHPYGSRSGISPSRSSRR